MHVRTKIVATIGPASAEPETLERLVRAGVDVCRINFSHGDEAFRQSVLDDIRRIEADLDRPVGVMADLCGPKIRVGKIAGGSVLLGQGAQLTVQREPIEGTPEVVSTTLGELVDEVEVGQVVLLDEGKIRLKVVRTQRPDRFVCEVTTGGVLASGKGVHLPETELKLPALTEKDRRDAAWIAARDFDFVALSFVQRPEDVRELRGLLGAEMKIVAKIEKPQALRRIEEIVSEADAIMVARGDLGVEMPLPRVPLVQKRLTAYCRSQGKACIVATQMLETMTSSPLPTRAEVADVANAVLDGTDAVMLSGETAVGKHPVRAVEVMNEIAAAAEEYEVERGVPMRVRYAPSPTTAALADAARAVIDAEEIAAVAVYTATGTTASVMSQHRLTVPILALAPSQKAVRQMGLLFGVWAVVEPAPEHTRDVLAAAEKHLRQRGMVRAGDRIVVLSGRPIHVPGRTNTLVVHTIGPG